MFFFSLSFLDKVKTEEIVNHDLDNYTCHWLYFCIHHTINTRFRIYITVSIKNKIKSVFLIFTKTRVTMVAKCFQLLKKGQNVVTTSLECVVKEKLNFPKTRFTLNLLIILA